MPKTYFEYRGVANAVYAKITKDDTTGITYGAVKEFTGVSEIGRTTESSSEAHYYDNMPVIVIDSVGSDEISINSSGIPLDILADICGYHWDADNGMMVEQEGTSDYFAFGYKTSKTDGTDIYVWRLKGKFSVPDLTAATKDDGTDANGQELTFTGVSTTASFTKTGKPARAINIDTSVNETITEADFFATVQTPDTVGTNP